MAGLHIAVDASRTTRRQRTGTENYALQLIRSMLALEANPHRFSLYFRDTPPEGLLSPAPNWSQRVIPWPRMWTHLRFAAALWWSRPDVTFVPAHTLPRFFPGRAVVTVHDLGYVHFPEAHPDDERRYLDWSTGFSSRRATLILADSYATQRDLTTYYGVSEKKIRVVYPGNDDALKPVTDPEVLANTRAVYGIPEKYLFFLGTLQPRKNVARLVKAYAHWREETGNAEISLVLGGKPGWLYDPAWIEGVPGVVQTGYIADADIAALYSGALAFVFPSLYEGFGFPVLEAMRCGTPVLCANTSSLPELVADAALLVDPLDVEAIAAGIARLVTDEGLRRELVDKGHRQEQQFTWHRAATEALATLEATAQHG